MSGHIFSIQNDDTLVEMNEEPFTCGTIKSKNYWRSIRTFWRATRSIVSRPAGGFWCSERWAFLTKLRQGTGGRWTTFCSTKTPFPRSPSSNEAGTPSFGDRSLDRCSNTPPTRYNLLASRGTLRAKFAETCKADKGSEPETLALLNFLGEGGDPEKFWQAGRRLTSKARRIRLLFVADVIPLELRRIVEFLNAIADSHRNPGGRDQALRRCTA